MPYEAELKPQSKTPVAHFRRRSAIFTSTGKVRSAFKSPQRSPTAPKHNEATEQTTPQKPTDELTISTVENTACVVTTYKRKRQKNCAFRTPTKASKLQEVVAKIPLNSNNETCEQLDESLAEEVVKLEQENAELDAEIVLLRNEGFEEADIQVYIEKLHQYNEIKDIGQMLLGQLACQSGTTTKQLYSLFSLDLSA